MVWQKRAFLFSIWIKSLLKEPISTFLYLLEADPTDCKTPSPQGTLIQSSWCNFVYWDQQHLYLKINILKDNAHFIKFGMNNVFETSSASPGPGITLWALGLWTQIFEVEVFHIFSERQNFFLSIYVKIHGNWGTHLRLLQGITLRNQIFSKNSVCTEIEAHLKLKHIYYIQLKRST